MSLLHAVTAIVLFLVLWRMTDELWPSAIVAGLFAIHPLRVESVAWVAERKDVLSGLFFMLTLAAYLGYVRHPFSLARYLAVVLLFALGLMAKPMLVTLPFVLLLLDYWPLGRFGGDCPHFRGHRDEIVVGESGTVPFRASIPGAAGQLPRQRILWRLVVEKLPLLALSAASCIITPLAQGMSVRRIDVLPASSRIANALVSYAAYLTELVYPVGLAVFYPHPGYGLPIWQVAGALLLLVGITVGALACRRRYPYLLVGWLWYLGMLVPVIGLVQVGEQSMADRYTYLPQIGVVVALAWGAKRLFAARPWRAWAWGVALCGRLAVLTGCAWRQTSYWGDSADLWRRALDCTTSNAIAHNGLGVVFARPGPTCRGGGPLPGSGPDQAP